jgi:hypothetical protein
MSDCDARYREEAERTLGEYSRKLRWGLSGHQGECWALLDEAIYRLVWLQRVGEAAAQVVVEFDRAERECVQDDGVPFVMQDALRDLKDAWMSRPSEPISDVFRATTAEEALCVVDGGEIQADVIMRRVADGKAAP